MPCEFSCRSGSVSSDGFWLRLKNYCFWSFGSCGIFVSVPLSYAILEQTSIVMWNFHDYLQTNSCNFKQNRKFPIKQKNTYVYDEYFDDVICPEYKALHYSTTNRDGYREYKSRSYLCADCPTKAMCTQNAKCEKTVTRHIWQRFVEMAEDVRHTPLYRDIYKLR